MPDLRGKTAIVTGPTGGIGEVCARELAGMGATVVLAARSADKARATLHRIKERYPDSDVSFGSLVDMNNPDSIRAFAAEFLRQGLPLHILLLNAGAYTSTRDLTKEGVPELCQTNHLGAYLLARLLEGAMVASAPARVVVVSSVLHRPGVLGADVARDFLRGEYGHYYGNTKLANVLMEYELQRRLGRHGVQSCAVDPGAVRTDVWRHSPWVVQRAVEALFAPPDAGAEAVLYAAVAPWDTAGDRVGDAGQARLPAEQDLRFYAPFAFASPLVSWGALGRMLMHWFGMAASTPWEVARLCAFGTAAMAVGVADWPLRQLSHGKLPGVKLVRSSPLSYDAELAATLWDASADVAGVPRACQLQR